METLSLKELKAQNESELNQENKEPEIIEEEIIEESEEVEELDEEVPKGDESEDLEADEDEPIEESNDLEEWQLSEDKAKGGKKFVPNAEAKKLRLKAKDLKAEARERDLELEELRSKVQSMSNVQPSQEPEPEAARPKLEDFDHDEDKHAEALDVWIDRKIERKLNTYTDNRQLEQKQQAQVQEANLRTEKAVSTHLESAASLINSGKITQDNWLKGDKLIRQTLELVMPQKGNQIADQFISLMESNGEGSEKAWYFLGNNPTALTQLKDKLMQDNTGASAIMYLSGLQSRAVKPSNKKRSGAPSPTDKLNGDAPTGSSKSAKKLYDKAGKTGDIGARVKIKRAAKKAGTDVSKW